MTDTLEAVAIALWRQDAVRAAPNVAKGRTVEAFAEQSPETRNLWLDLAQAAITAARPLIMGEAAGIAMEVGQHDWFGVGKVVRQASRDIATAIRAAGERA